MVVKLNLASQPFRNRTLPWAVAAVVASLSLLALVYFVAESQRARAEADAQEAQVQVLRGEREQLTAQAAQIREELSPEQRETLRAAHALVDRKSFSWSQLFSDLEDALPAGVRVSRINVRDVSQRGQQTRAEVDLTVVGRAPDDVTGMIAEMGRRGFSVAPLTENQKSGKGEGGYEWTLRVSYVQGAERRSDDADQSARLASPPAVEAARVAGRE